MPFLFWPIVSGVVVSWLLRKADIEIQAFIWFWVLIILLASWPQAAAWLVVLTVGFGLLVALSFVWEYVLGFILGCFMFLIFIAAFLSAIQ